MDEEKLQSTQQPMDRDQSGSNAVAKQLWQWWT